MSDVLHNCPGCNGTEFTHLLDVEAQMHPSAEKFAFHQCTSCGMVMLNPRVKPERLHEYYTASYVPYRGPEAWGRYASFVASDQRQMDSNRLKKLRQHSRIDASHLILDIGCGKPSFLQKVHDSTGATCVGLDFSDLGWRDEPNRYEKLELQIGEVEDVTLARAPDIVTMWHYLEHDYHPDQTLQKLSDRSKGDTLLFIEVPNYDSLSRVKYGAKWAGWHTPRHTFLYQPSSITSLLNRSGWEVVSIESKGTLNDYALYWMSEMEQRGIDWSQNLENEFWGFVKGMMIHKAKNILPSQRSHGVMLVIARRR